MQKFFLLTIFLIFCTFSFADNNEQVLKLNWIDLIPYKERNLIYDNDGNPVAKIEHEGELSAMQSKIGSVREELDNSQVQIPGFVIPLEGDENILTEFLLVPYFGACIHVPPPPLNQIIYVKFQKGAPVQQLWDVVYIVGKLRTKSTTTDIAKTGYYIDGIEILKYED